MWPFDDTAPRRCYKFSFLLVFPLSLNFKSYSEANKTPEVPVAAACPTKLTAVAEDPRRLGADAHSKVAMFKPSPTACRALPKSVAETMFKLPMLAVSMVMPFSPVKLTIPSQVIPTFETAAAFSAEPAAGAVRLKR